MTATLLEQPISRTKPVSESVAVDQLSINLDAEPQAEQAPSIPDDLIAEADGEVLLNKAVATVKGRITPRGLDIGTKRIPYHLATVARKWVHKHQLPLKYKGVFKVWPKTDMKGRLKEVSIIGINAPDTERSPAVFAGRVVQVSEYKVIVKIYPTRKGVWPFKVTLFHKGQFTINELDAMQFECRYRNERFHIVAARSLSHLLSDDDSIHRELLEKSLRKATDKEDKFNKRKSKRLILKKEKPAEIAASPDEKKTKKTKTKKTKANATQTAEAKPLTQTIPKKTKAKSKAKTADPSQATQTQTPQLTPEQQLARQNAANLLQRAKTASDPRQKKQLEGLASLILKKAGFRTKDMKSKVSSFLVDR